MVDAMDPILISVIIPVYNTDLNYLRQCISSVISQKYETIEIIIVDDGNDKDYSDKLDCFPDTDTRIRVLHKNNEGQGSSRNYGVQYANGEYVFFMDSDDYISPYAIENAVSIARRISANMIVGGKIHVTREQEVYFPSTENKIITVETKEEKESYLNHILGYRNARYELSAGALGDSACSILIKKEILLQARFENDKYWDEDSLWNMLSVTASKKILIVDNLWYAYIINPESTIRGYKGDRTYEFQFRAKQEYERMQRLWPNCAQGKYYLVWVGLLAYCRTDIFHKKNHKTLSEKYSCFLRAIDFDEFKDAIRNIDFSNEKNLIKRNVKNQIKKLLQTNRKLAFVLLLFCTKVIKF